MRLESTRIEKLEPREPSSYAWKQGLKPRGLKSWVQGVETWGLRVQSLKKRETRLENEA